MNKKIIIGIALLISNITFSKELTCDEVQEREIKVNSKTSIRVRKLHGVCSFIVETSKDKRKFNYSKKEFEASREWIFQSTGKILIHSSYGTAPTDSSATAYKGYQLFPNNKKLKVQINEDGTFRIQHANGAKIYFNNDGSINKEKTKDLKLKDTPIKVPNIAREKSSVKYEELNHLSYGDKRKSSIRIYHRQLNSQATSRSIGLETKSGMYIPLGTEMGKIPGNSTNASYTLYGVDDEKLCKQRMPAHYFFDYLVKCSSRAPNKRCACKYSDQEAQDLYNKNRIYEKEIRSITWNLSSSQGTEKEKLERRLEELNKLYRPNLYSETNFTCSLDKADAHAFIAGKKISGDNREIEGVSVKKTSKIIDGLIDSKKCRKLKKAYRDCEHCFDKEIINIDSIEKQSELIQGVIEEL